jgi:predicted ATP-binding protein involved in virulence
MTNRKERRIAEAKRRHDEKKNRRLLNEAKQYSYAFADGIQTLYKFKAFSTSFDEQVVREILIDHTIYFARADQLNDDTEMKIRHAIDGDPHDPQVCARVIKHSERLMRAHRPRLSEEVIAAEIGVTSQLRVL